ncbi:MAG: metallophosphoesterase [Xenococcaceae cyanobacterium]
MNFSFRFGVASDLHIAVPQTVNNHATRFHLTEVSIPVLERVFAHLESSQLDFLLLPGDLTQDGEPENHQWLAQRLAKLPFPVYVIPGNHDVPNISATEKTIAFAEFPSYYEKFGYQNSQQHYYDREILPGVRLIALNSNNFNQEGKQLGFIDKTQLLWLEETLEKVRDKLVLVMIHHNVIEHLPDQSKHPLGKRYMLANATELLAILQKYGVKLIFTGHLHVQDVAELAGIYEICTGSLVSYPHPYRIIDFKIDDRGNKIIDIESHQIKSIAGWSNLAHTSREWLGDRSFPFMFKLLTSPPLNLPETEAAKYAPQLRYFWADIALGDTVFDFPEFPPKLKEHFQKFGALDSDGKPKLIDNQATIFLSN